MHDGTGQIIKFYEVGIGSNVRPSDINGHRVIEILRQDGAYAGQFSSADMQIRINYDNSGFGIRPGRNLDTPIHELGHALGLMDLETDGSGIPRGTHHTLMGYNRGTTNINRAIQYQDIQGIAVLNNRHTQHQFKKYVVSGNNYLHICFYCDRIESQRTIMSGSTEICETINCIHDYQPMVSAGDRHWFKCTKCYNVIESNDFYVQGVKPNALKITGLIDSSMTSIIIPRQIGGINVTEIGENAFINKTDLSKVTLQI